MKKADFAIIAGILLIALLGWWAFSAGSGGGEVYVVVIKDGQEALREPLEGLDTVWDDGHNRVVIKDGVVRMEWSDCKNQVCVHAGSIREAGQQITCLPNRVMVRLEAEDAGLDGMTY